MYKNELANVWCRYQCMNIKHRQVHTSARANIWQALPMNWYDYTLPLLQNLNLSFFRYVPWNLHEPEKDVFDFGQLDNDFSPFLNVTRFLEVAQEEDLLVIFRPGSISGAIIWGRVCAVRSSHFQSFQLMYHECTTFMDGCWGKCNEGVEYQSSVWGAH